MAFLWGSGNSTQFDQLVEQCTSDLLPAKSPLDLDAALRIADAVRSATVPPTDAALKLVTRLGHENPNVQLLALQLADVLVKNAGNQFLKAFASSATTTGGAVNELERLCSSSSSGTTTAHPPVNRDVQLAARQKLQEWASAFEASGRPLLSQSDLVNLYHRLRATAVPFPAQADATTTAAMVDSLSAPDWSDSPYCTRCRTEFSTFNRKHHCRNCGHVFDQQCSSQSMPLPHYGITTESVRVCDACAKQIKQGKGAQVARTILQQQQQAATTTTTTTRRRREDEEAEDADLQRAIRASLAESTSAASHGPVRHSPPPLPSSSSSAAAAGYHPSYASQIQSSSDSKKEEEEADPDLAAAIAASLKDLEAAASRPSPPPPPRASAPAPAQTYSDLFPSSDNRVPSSSAPKTATAFHLPSYDLTAAEQSHLSQFLSSSSSSPAYPATNESYRLVSEVLQPKLDRSLRDARTRGEILREMEAKLSEAARLYGTGLLTERVVQQQQQQPQPQPQAYRSSSSYSNPTASASNAYPTPYQDPAAVATTRYQYAPPPIAAAGGIGYGQPLPAYAVPAVVPPQTVDAASVPVAAQQQQQQQQEYNPAAAAPPPPLQQHFQQQLPQQQQEQQQPAGFYKPSQFPPVPQTDPHSQSVLGLPNVPRENPWNTNDVASDRLRRREEEEEDEEEEEEREEPQNVGELIEL